MHIENACKIIAFYMGYRDAYNPCDNEFSKNSNVNKYLVFENLIPVWEKFENIGFNIRFDKGEWACDHCYYLIDSVNDEYRRDMPNNVENLVHKMTIATALAIMENDSENIT